MLEVISIGIAIVMAIGWLNSRFRVAELTKSVADRDRDIATRNVRLERLSQENSDLRNIISELKSDLAEASKPLLPLVSVTPAPIANQTTFTPAAKAPTKPRPKSAPKAKK